MENDHHVSQEEADWVQIQSPFSAVTAKLSDGSDNHSLVKDNESCASPPEELPVCGNPEENDEPEKNRLSLTKWERLCFAVSQSGVLNFVRKYVGFWSFCVVVLASIFGGKAVVLWQRLVQAENAKQRLVLLLMEKDKKMKQLLLQMNEILLGRRKVGVIRVKGACRRE